MAADPFALLALAEAVALEAGRLLVERAGPGIVALTKSSAVDMVTEVDRAAEALIAERLLAARPDDGLLGEEGASRTGSSGVTWVIDPLDGTTNYLYGLPDFCVSIAAVDDGRPLAGVVCEPRANRIYRAARGRGAWCGDRRLAVTRADELATALIATGFGYSSRRRAQQGALVGALLPHVRDIRRSGSAALDLCRVAAGQLDGYYEHGVQRWDVAAGELLVREAGGEFVARPLAGGGLAVVASGPALFPSLVEAVASAGGRDID